MVVAERACALEIKNNSTGAETFIKNKNYRKLSQKLSKRRFDTTKIVVYGSKLSKIYFFYKTKIRHLRWLQK